MSNSNAVSNVHGPGSGDPLNALYVAAPSTNRPSKIGYAADVDRRACQVSRDLEMDFQPVWQQPHPAAPEIEARVKTVLTDITCDPNVFGLYTNELFAVRSEVVVAVAEAEIKRFAAEMEASREKNDMIPFRMMKGVAQDLADYAEESGQTVSEVLRERVRGYLSGTIVLIAPKSTQFHKKTGYVYFVSMMILLITAFMIYRLFDGWGIFHYLAVVSLITLFGGMIPVWFRKSIKSWKIIHLSFMYWSVFGLYAAFSSETLTRVPDSPFFGMVGIATAIIMIGGGAFFFYKKATWKRS